MKYFLVMQTVVCYLVLSVLLGSSALAEVASVPLPKGILPLAARPAPELVLNDIDGNRFELTQFLAKPLKQKRGRWVFVHFWASWCGPCRREIPAIQRMLERLSKLPEEKAIGVAIVNTAENEDAVFSFLGVLAPDIVPLMDSDGTVTEAWKPRGLPSTYLVDPAGIIRYQALGGRPWGDDEYVQFLTTLSVKPEKN